jgi:glycosyltransferase involved in cell wall biosynthesis
MSRELLFLAYFFPPVGGAGVQRSVKFARYLPAFGFRPRIVTGRGAAEGRWTPKDDSLALELAGDLPVFRIEEPEPGPPARTRARLERWLRVRSRWSAWWVGGAVAAGLRAAAGVRPCAIYATMGPYETARAAGALSSRLGIPWIADLRDPWALDEMMIYPTRLHRRLELAEMRRSLASAAAVIMNTPEAKRALCTELRSVHPEKVFTIENGFDRDDFDAPARRQRSPVFRIVHTGYLHTELGLRHRRGAALRRLLGGARIEIDILTRSHVVLLEALAKLFARDPTALGQVELSLAGPVSQADRDAVARSGVAQSVREVGYLSHRASVELVRSADLLFLPMHDLPAGERSRIVPGKAYEYMASGRPVLAAVPDGDARDYLARAGSGRLCRPGDADGMAGVLAEELGRWRRGEGDPEVDRAFLEGFERRNQARKLAQVLGLVVEGVPRSVVRDERGS